MLGMHLYTYLLADPALLPRPQHLQRLGVAGTEAAAANAAAPLLLATPRGHAHLHTVRNIATSIDPVEMIRWPYFTRACPVRGLCVAYAGVN